MACLQYYELSLVPRSPGIRNMDETSARNACCLHFGTSYDLLCWAEETGEERDEEGH
jgi:hypothetical protein